MKFILLTIIAFYQKLLSPLLKQLLGIKASCRFTPTCSEYARQSVEAEGAIKGSAMAMKRLLYCQPFAKTMASTQN